MSKLFDKNMEREIERSDSSSSSDGSSGRIKSKKRMPALFKRIKAKESWRWKLRYLWSAFKWKRVNLQLSFFNDVLFKIVSVLEAIVLVVSLSFFFLCCGCHF